MKTAKRILFGLILVAIGVLLILDVMDVFSFELFFRGWWTLFIIIPCLFGLFSHSGKLLSLFGLFVGVFLLLAANGIVEYALFRKLVIPVIVVLVGLGVLFGNLFSAKREKARKKAEEKLYEKGGEMKEFCSTFSDMKLDMSGQRFDGAVLTAVFGNLSLDLRNAVIENDVVIKLCVVFGNVELRLPEDMKVSVSVTQIFSGISDTHSEKSTDRQRTLHLSGSSIFGGGTLK